LIRNRRRVVVTGLGVVSPVGVTLNEFFDSLVSGRSGIRPFGDSGHVVGAVSGFDPSAHFTKAQLVGLDRVSQLGLVASDQALEDAALRKGSLDGAKAGIYFGTGIGGANALETGYDNYFDKSRGRVPPLTVISAMANATAAHLSIRHGIRGPVLTYSIACASSAVAIGEAFRAIRDGYLDIAITGGAEAMTTPGMVEAWAAMRVLAKTDADYPERSCRPFSKERTGLVLGEGAAVLILEALETARGRPPRIWAELAGYGIAGDASHISRPSLDGQVAALSSAIEDAGLNAADIGYINAHGTATQVGDAVETAAIKKALGGAAYKVPVSSTKALHGHLMGAAGAIEMVATVMALHTGTIPPTCHYSEPDPECDLDYVPNTARTGLSINAAASNSFAFGGTNAVLVARKFLGSGA
jgi:3-oxoacyl-[acyl-carrier-protein] synthase II